MVGPREAHVIVVSTSAAAKKAADRTGPVIRTWLEEQGFHTSGPEIVADGEPVGAALRAAVDAGTPVVITTGGTGVSPDDATPEQTAPLLDIEVPGIMEQLRRTGATSTPTAVLTRGLAGFAESSFIVNLPGSIGGVRDGLQVLEPVLKHLLAQRTGAAGADPAPHSPRS